MTAAVRLLQGDCVEQMRTLADASVDAVVTDPPYGINFMGKAWDGADIEKRAAEQRKAWLERPRPSRLTGSPESDARKTIERTHSAFQNRSGEAGAYDFSLKGNRAFQEWTRQWAAEAFRVLKPGGHALVFGGTRTYHRMAAGLEDAGFDIRDCIAWMFGSGFPKSLDVSKAIDKQAGAEREVVGRRLVPDAARTRPHFAGIANAGDGTPTREVDVTAAATDEARAWDGWGTALKPAFEPIVVARKPLEGTVAANVLAHGTGAINVDGCRIGDTGGTFSVPTGDGIKSNQVYGTYAAAVSAELDAGRWPANMLLDPDAAQLLDSQAGEPQSRFFYCAKVSRAERNAGLDGFEAGRNHHPTVKPIDLMRWLIRLVTPPDGTVLDPFLGSGTTGCAAVLEGRPFLGCERETEYMQIANARIAFWAAHGEDGLRICAERDAAERRESERRDAGQLSMFDLPVPVTAAEEAA